MKETKREDGTQRITSVVPPGTSIPILIPIPIPRRREETSTKAQGRLVHGRNGWLPPQRSRSIFYSTPAAVFKALFRAPRGAWKAPSFTPFKGRASPCRVDQVHHQRCRSRLAITLLLLSHTTSMGISSEVSYVCMHVCMHVCITCVGVPSPLQMLPSR